MPHHYSLRIFQFTTAGENQTRANEHTPVACYENLAVAPVVPQIGTYFQLRDPAQERDHRLCAGRVTEVVTVLYGTCTSVQIYLAPQGKRPRSENELELLKIAAYFQDDYTKKLPVIAAFRQWRNGTLSTDAFLKRLGDDDLGDVLRHDPVPPMRGLAILNDYIPDPEPE